MSIMFISFLASYWVATDISIVYAPRNHMNKYIQDTLGESKHVTVFGLAGRSGPYPNKYMFLEKQKVQA